MRRFDIRNLAILLLLGVVFWPTASASAKRGAGEDANRDIVALTGQIGSGVEVLYLVDTRTRHLSVYRVHGGKRIELVAARNCTYDLRLETLNDNSPELLRPGVLRRSWQQFNKGAVPEKKTPESAGSEKKSEAGSGKR